MDRQVIIDKLRKNESALRARGARGAVWLARRGDNRPDSDIDILIDIAPQAGVGLWEYLAITQYLEDLFSGRVDVADHSCVKSQVRPSAERESVYAF